MSSVFLGVAAALAWGLHDFLARFPSRAVGPAPTVLAVTITGFCFLSLGLFFSGDKLHLSWPEILLPALSGTALALATLSLFTALSLGPISLVAPIAGSYPAVAVSVAFIQGSRPSLIQWLAIAAVMAGVMLVSRSGRFYEEAGDIEQGKLGLIIALSLLASLGFATALTSGQAAVPIFGEVATIWLARIFGLLTIGTIALARPSRLAMARRWLPFLALMGGLDVTALGTIIAAGNLPDPAFATVVSSAFGAVTVVLARLFLKEAISPAQLAGMAMIFGGVAVLAGT
jgi:drug/metabolite transporter (DMT)-like permease